MNGYELYEFEPNTIHRDGRVFIKHFNIDTDNNFKDRKVRVYLPSTYNFDDPNHRFRVIYIFDGKNLFDDYTSYTGEWNIDESIEDMINRNVTDGYIVVGVDAPETDIDRSLEMSPKELTRLNKYKLGEGYAHKLAKFVVNVLKKDIDENFYTLKEKEFTGVGGSSMGGLMAFYVAMEYSSVFKYSLAFSPAFFLFSWDSVKAYLDKKTKPNTPYFYFFIGGKGFERLFVETTHRVYNYFYSKGFSHKRNKLIYDSDLEHHEKSWGKYFPIMLEAIDK